jgi:hypothetical protein
MKSIITSIGAFALVMSSGLALAGHGHGGGASGMTPVANPTHESPAMGTPATQPTTPSGRTRAQGQPNVECGSATAPNTPGNAAEAPGSAFNEDGTAGQHYAGQQPQNSKNPASVSQYDTACAHQPG